MRLPNAGRLANKQLTHLPAQGYPPIIAKELQDAHYLAAYNQGDDDEAPVNEALRALGEKQVD